MSSIGIAALIGWGLLALFGYMYLRLHKKHALMKGVNHALEAELKAAQDRIADLSPVQPDGVRLDEEENIRRH